METSTGAAWRMVGESVTGTAHLRTGTSCEDAHACRVLPEGIVMLAVADGAGSASRAREGSRIAVDAALHFLEAEFERKQGPEVHCRLLLERARDIARSALEASADDAGVGEFATTLLLAVLTDEVLTTLQIGDGGIVCRRRGGQLEVLPHTSRGEYVNETTFLTSDGYREASCIAERRLGEIDGIALFSDGVEFLGIQYASRSAHPAFFEPLFACASSEENALDQLRTFLASDRVNARTDDDKTLVLAVRHELS